MNCHVTIDLKKLRHNATFLHQKCRESGISLMGVTKGVSGSEEIAMVFVESGLDYIADSRVKNLKKLKNLDCKKVLLRVPALSEIEELIQYVDLSLNSEIKVIRAISDALKGTDKIHEIILMVDVGEFREGLLPSDVEDTIKAILQLEHIKLVGIGTTLTCVNGVIPDEKNLSELAQIAADLSTRYDLDLKVISGGNSSSYYLLEKGNMPKGINNLRLGELLLLGRETAYGDLIEGLNTDVFEVAIEIVELKTKPSVPIGNVGMDAFGKKPILVDKGNQLRALLSTGLQDVSTDYLIPKDEKIEIIGASSDYILVDLTHTETMYEVGDCVRFDLKYGAIMQLFTSEYVEKVYREV